MPDDEKREGGLMLLEKGTKVKPSKHGERQDGNGGKAIYRCFQQHDASAQQQLLSSAALASPDAQLTA